MRTYIDLAMLLIVLLLIPSIGYTADKDPDPIDKRLEECINRDSTTAGMNICTDAAYVEWDKSLNDIYKKLMNKLDKEAKKALKNSQREWIKYRDAEFNFINSFYNSFQGTIWSNVNHGTHLGLVRSRAQILRSYLNNYEMK